MPTLTIRRGHQAFSVGFEAPERLSALLERAGQPLDSPCGGRGVCGKCAVLLSGDVSAPNGAEDRCGARLACQAVIRGDAAVILPQTAGPAQIEAGPGGSLTPGQSMPGRYGAAADIGTTTLALRLYDMASGACLAVTTMLNPQTSVAADVIGRIGAAMAGGMTALRDAVLGALNTMLHQACAQAEVAPESVASLTLCGNTAMLYLLTGRDPVSLSHAPFEADHLFGEEREVLGRRCYLPDCLQAFVGADTTCALLASGMTERPETALMCDVGTNGEIALWRGGQLYIASTAAGPAFEGAGVSCGCGSIPGAIDRAEATADGLRVHTIGGLPPVGLCGSGLVDVVAALLEMEDIDETGAMEAAEYPLADGVSLTRQDVRALQLAKAAICAGVESLLHAAGCPAEEVTTVYLAGGFGSHMNMDSAARIGLLPPELAERVRVIGNAALHGAARLLTDTACRARCGELQRIARHVRLDGNAFFSQRFVEAMLLGGDE